MNDDLLFTLRVPLSDGFATIRAYDGGKYEGANNDKIEVSVHHKGGEIFPRGLIYCGTSACGGMSIDGDRAKELVLSLVAMRLGDTDREYFNGYTQKQLDWTTMYGEEIDLVRCNRYCVHGTGEVKSWLK